MRTPLKNRILPNYTFGEELFNMISHIVGATFGIVALIMCIIKSSGNVYGIVTSIIYGLCMIILYTMSSIYHGLKHGLAKKVFQVLDHCAIYLLIAGTYTPIALVGIRPMFVWHGWGIFAFEWIISFVIITLNAIDLKRFKNISMILNLFLGWAIIFILPQALQALHSTAFWLILSGGIFYTIGAILYGIGKKQKYMHSVFHLFVLAGSVLQFIAIYAYIL